MATSWGAYCSTHATDSAHMAELYGYAVLQYSTLGKHTFMRLRKFPPVMPLFLFGGSLTTTVLSALK